MRNTSKAAYHAIRHVLSGELSPELKVVAGDLIRKRFESKKPQLRPSVFRFAYEVTGGKKWEEHALFAGAFELLNISTYSFNQMIDGKTENDFNNHKQSRGNDTVAGLFQLAQSLRFIFKESSAFSKDKYLKIHERVFKLNTLLCEGLLIDINALSSFEGYTDEKYLVRCEGISGSFIQIICEIAAILADAGEEKVQEIGRFGKNLGTILQLINDLADFIPPEEGKDGTRIYKHAFSDLKGNTITYPASLIYTEGTAEEKALLDLVKGNSNPSHELLSALAGTLMKYHGVERIKAKAGVFKNTAEVHLNSFEKCEARDWLSLSLNIADTNFVYKKLPEYASAPTTS